MGSDLVSLNRIKLLTVLKELERSEDISKLRRDTIRIKSIVQKNEEDLFGISHIESDAQGVSFRLDVLTSDLGQIVEAQTIERAKYYVNRLLKGIQQSKNGKNNDMDFNRWKEYDEIITDSLWVLEKRDNNGAHLASFWGNFVPQIPHQLMLRYTKKGDWVLDTFVGSGTTLIECRRLGRNGIGIELNPKVAEEARKIISKESSENGAQTEIVVGDSRSVNIGNILASFGIQKVQLLIMHPPYHDIIKFSEDEKDLSNAKSEDTFYEMFDEVVDNASPFLEEGAYLGLVIGDKYARGVWVPLGFRCMNRIMEREEGDFILKSVIVKNFDETRGKRNQKELWRYRALVGGFYVFKHEYIFLFQKIDKSMPNGQIPLRRQKRKPSNEN